jgi:hypothetical protein
MDYGEVFGVSKWISVEDRLPEEHTNLMGSGFSDNVIVIDASGYMTVCNYMYPWRNMSLLGFRPPKGSNIKPEEITHWMPLPEPPK